MERELSRSTLKESFERYVRESKNGINRATASAGGGGGIESSVSDGHDEDEDQDTGDDDDYADNEDDNDYDDGDDGEEVDPVNVELNFLKYILESHASQLGGPGPASQLFSQLGLNLPHLPPMNEVKK
jgi:hypothetical protein